EAQLGGEPGRAEHPQRVVAERVLRPSWRAQHPGLQVTYAAERVDDLQRGQPRRDGVDREVPASQVRLQRPPVRHLRRLVGFWPVLLAAVCRDLADQTAPAKAHGAELDSGVPDRL